jgi:hypothetical protein
MGLLDLLVFLIVIGVMFWAIGQWAGAFNIPAPIVTVIQVFLVIFVVLYLLQGVGVNVGPTLRLH